MRRGDLTAIVLLTAAGIASGVGVVYAKYLTRQEFTKLQGIVDERHVLDVQWERLRLEEATLTTDARVEDRARRLLGMHLPQSGEVRVILGDGK